MGFRRYDGYVNSEYQKKVDKGMPICPFCGQDAHWLLNIDTDNGVVTCMCDKCNGQLRIENDESFTQDKYKVVSIGSQNNNSLALNEVYTVKTLKKMGSRLKVGDNLLENQSIYYIRQEDASVDGAKFLPSMATTAVTASTSYRAKTKKTQILVAMAIFLTLISVAVIIVLATVFADGKDAVTIDDFEMVVDPQMKVDELYNSYYYVSVEGKLKNSSSIEMDYVRITFTFYDSDGNEVGSASDKVSALKDGYTWEYFATSITVGERPVRCEITSLKVKY